MAFAERPPSRWQRWQNQLQQRLSSQGLELRLHRRNLYILPTAFGAAWLLLIAIIYLLGIQSRSNGPVLLALLMLALLLLGPFLTHRNLEGLELRCLEPGPGYADTPLQIQLATRSAVPRTAAGTAGTAAIPADGFSPAILLSSITEPTRPNHSLPPWVLGA